MDDVDRLQERAPRPQRVRVHVAGVIHDDVQRCVRCGLTLADYRGAMTVSTDKRQGGFEVGALIAAQGPGKWVTGPKLEANEMPCNLFEVN